MQQNMCQQSEDLTQTMYSYIPVREWEAFKNTSTQRECVYKNEKGTKKNNENNNDLYDVHEHFNIYDGFLKWVLHEKSCSTLWNFRITF